MGSHEKIRSFFSETWDFVKRIKVMDSGLEKEEQISEADIILDEFSYSLAQTCKRITAEEKAEHKKDGIIFLIDEADNSCPNLHVGYFFKTVTETIQKYNVYNVMFVAAGLPDLIEKLADSHESSVRIFNQMVIKELKVEDRKYVITKGLEEGDRINDCRIRITEEAKSSISTLSEGYPHFIQQFAYSAYEVNTDGEISAEDVSLGAVGPGGAIEAIGTRYYARDYHNKIKSDEYREVLSIMANKFNSWIKKSEIKSQFSGTEKTLSNALAALTSRKIILKNPSKMGEYRLQQKGFALWITLFGNRNKI